MRTDLAAAILIAAALAILAAALWPGAWLGLLLVLVILQDWLSARGIPFVQFADETLVLAGLAGIAVRTWMRIQAEGARPAETTHSAEAAHRVTIPRTPLDLPTLAFAAVGVVAAIAEDIPPVVAALGLVALMKGLLAFQLGARTPLSDRGLARGLRIILGLIAALALIGLLQRLGGEPIYRVTGQAGHFATWAGGKTPSLFFNHNAFGHALVLGGALALGLALAAGRRTHAADGLEMAAGRPALATGGRDQRRLALIALACLAGLVVAGSREAWLAAAVGVAVVAAVGRSRRLVGLAAVVVVVIGVGAVTVSLGSPLMRAELARRSAGIGDGWHAYRLGFTGREFRGEYRVYVLLKSWDIFLDHPVWGTGPGRFGGQVAVRYPSPVYPRYDFLPLDGQHAPLDVFWARLLTEFGLAGTLFYLAAFTLALRIHWRSRRSDDPLTRGLGLGGLMAWVAILLLGVFSPALEDPLTAIPLWVWAGVVWRRSWTGALNASGGTIEDRAERRDVGAPNP